MLKAKDIMTEEVITVTPDTGVAEAAKILLENRINGLPVVDDTGNLVGIICQSDLIAQQKNIPLPSLFTLLEGFMPLTSMKRIDKEVQKISAMTVNQAMTPDPVNVNPETDILHDVKCGLLDFRNLILGQNPQMYGTFLYGT